MKLADEIRAMIKPNAGFHTRNAFEHVAKLVEKRETELQDEIDSLQSEVSDMERRNLMAEMDERY